MRTFTLIFSALIVILISTRVTAMPAKESGGTKTCKIVTGYGTATGHGETLLKAKENARLICGSSLIDDYIARRRDIPEETKIDLALACVNLECQ